MADIKQAAKWMRQGLTVRREEWTAMHNINQSDDDDSVIPFIWCDDMGMEDLRDEEDDNAILELDDLLADDWQIAE